MRSETINTPDSPAAEKPVVVGKRQGIRNIPARRIRGLKARNRIRANAKNAFLLFWIWPFGSFLMAVRNIRSRAYHPIILMFAFIYGYSVYMYSGDVVRYAEAFEQITHANWRDYFYLLQQSYTGKGYGIGSFGVVATQPDLYALTMQFLVSRVTENCRWFFGIVSLVYAWFFLGFINELIPEIKWRKGFVLQNIFFIYLLFCVPFFYPVIGVRFWTALSVFMLFSIKHIKKPSIKYLLLSSISIVIHYTFILPVFILVLYNLIKVNRSLITLMIFVALLFSVMTTSSQKIAYVGSTSSYFEGSRIENRIDAYTNQDIKEQIAGKRAKTNWYVRWNRQISHFFLTAVFIIEFILNIKWKQTLFLKKLYPFYVLFFTISLSLHGVIDRYSYIFAMIFFMRFTILIGLNPKSRFLRMVSLLLIPILILHLAIVFRSGFYTVDPLLLISPAAVLLFIQSKTSLSELIVGH